MRTPRVTQCKAMVAGPVALMAAGVAADIEWLQRTAVLAAIYVAVQCIRVAIGAARTTLEAYIKTWAHKPFEDGYVAGFAGGREAGIAEGFTLATGQTERQPSGD